MITIPEVKAAGGYQIIYADPAWQYSDKGSNGAADKHYPTLSAAQISALPVSEIAAPDAVLFLWVTWPFLVEGLDLIRSWGFSYKTLGFLWVKSQGEKAFFGLGRWTRGNSEVCLLGVRGKPNGMVQSHAVRQLVFAPGYVPPETFEGFTAQDGETVSAPRGEHSAKPPEVRDRIVSLLGDRPRIELFARQHVEGWDAWGNEVDKDVSL